jgi:predicted nucleic acid-binding protein
MRVFVDANVLLDVLANRRPFYRDAARIWTLAESGKIEALISAISFNNVYYVVRKASDRKTAEKALQLMRNIFVAVPLTVQILSRAIDAGFSDFEDAIQFHSAVHAGAARIITRDADHFPVADIPAISPAAFLASFAPE